MTEPFKTIRRNYWKENWCNALWGPPAIMLIYFYRDFLLGIHPFTISMVLITLLFIFGTPFAYLADRLFGRNVNLLFFQTHLILINEESYIDTDDLDFKYENIETIHYQYRGIPCWETMNVVFTNRRDLVIKSEYYSRKDYQWVKTWMEHQLYRDK